jgi:hypothetical protein
MVSATGSDLPKQFTQSFFEFGPRSIHFVGLPPSYLELIHIEVNSVFALWVCPDVVVATAAINHPSQCAFGEPSLEITVGPLKA